MKDPAKVEAGRRARKLGAAAQKKEADWWVEQGFRVEGNFKFARYIGPGKLVTVPHDLFSDPKTGQAGFDHVAIYHGLPTAMVGIQTTIHPFESSSGRADRNAGHSLPPFSWVPPTIGVEEWVGRVQIGDTAGLPVLAQVIVSRAKPKAPERRWWYRD